jgi:hypothetical protein
MQDSAAGCRLPPGTSSGFRTSVVHLLLEPFRERVTCLSDQVAQLTVRAFVGEVENVAESDIHAAQRDSRVETAQLAAGIAPLRRVYDLRHTFATFALRAGVSTFDLSVTWEPA